MRAKCIGDTTAAAAPKRWLDIMPEPRQDELLQVGGEPRHVVKDLGGQDFLGFRARAQVDSDCDGRTRSLGELSSPSGEEEEDEPSMRHVSKSEAHDLG